MFCPKCGKKVPEEVEKCPSCGNPVEKAINLSDVANYASQQMNKAVSGVSAKAQASVEVYKKEQNERNISSLSDMIIGPQERQVAVMGSSYLDSMLHGGGLSKGFGLLTDKRFYFKGKCLTKSAGQYKAVDEEYTVDLENITATGFMFARRVLFLVFAILVLIATIFFTADTEEIGFFVCGIVVAFVLFDLYLFSKRTIYEVHFGGGVICVNVSKYGGLSEVKKFNKALRQAKDRRR